MDDANLTRLKISSGELIPPFNTDVFEYTVVVGSTVTKATFSCDTRDSGASYQLKGAQGSKTVGLQEGAVTSVKIEVTSEDGSNTKYYCVAVKRLSAKDASLSGLSIGDDVIIDPKFCPDLLSYTAAVPYNTCDVTVTMTTNDKGVKATVVGGDKVELSCGVTVIIVSVTSPDGSVTQSYEVEVTRRRPPRPVTLVESMTSLVCPLCLNVVHCPVAINDGQWAASFCSSCLETYTRAAKVNPLTGRPLDPGWRIPDSGTEARVSGVTARCPFYYRGCPEVLPLRRLGAHTADCGKSTGLELGTSGCPECGRSVPAPETTWHKEFLCSTRHGLREPEHRVEAAGWESRMRTGVGDDAKQLREESDKLVEEYKSLVSRPSGESLNKKRIREALNESAGCLATAIKLKPKDASLHFRLGQILEEMSVARDRFGLSEEEERSSGGVGSESEAVASGKEEEIVGICEKHGFPTSSSLADKLRAIDAECRALQERGESADYVRGLYAWKSRQATQAGRIAALVEGDLLGRGFGKYLDASSLDPGNPGYNAAVGRLALLLGRIPDAVRRLQVAVGLKPALLAAKFHLGNALLKQAAGGREKEAQHYLSIGAECLLARLGGSHSDGLSVEDDWNPGNTQILDGLLSLANLLKSSKNESSMSVDEVIAMVTGLATRGLAEVQPRGLTNQQLMWIVLRAHWLALEVLESRSRDSARGRVELARFAGCLGGLVRSSGLPAGEDSIGLQLRAAQAGVRANPCLSHGLALLGDAQLARYEYDPSNAIALNNAVSSYSASIGLEGKEAVGEPPMGVREQNWWGEETKKEVAAKVPAKGAIVAPRGATVIPRSGATRGGTVAARGGTVAARGGAVAARGGAVAARGGAVAARGGAVAARGGGLATRGGAAKPVVGKPGPGKEGGGKRPSISGKSPGAGATATVSAPVPVPVHGPINPTSYQPRLGLARCHARQGEWDKAKDYYLASIDMAPYIHDSYIEAGEVLIRAGDIPGAVDIYGKFPFADSEEKTDNKSVDSFDDAYLHGEIVRLLMKQGSYDDVRLPKHMVEWGRVYGLGILDKYVAILEDKFKSKLLMEVYAGVNRKPVADPEMQAFFKFKCWS